MDKLAKQPEYLTHLQDFTQHVYFFVTFVHLWHLVCRIFRKCLVQPLLCLR
jgi:hypothetical protein